MTRFLERLPSYLIGVLVLAGVGALKVFTDSSDTLLIVLAILGGLLINPSAVTGAIKARFGARGKVTRNVTSAESDGNRQVGNE